MNNIYNEEKDYNGLIDIDAKNQEESMLYFEPDWVPLGRLSVTSDGRKVPTGPLYVPSNLLGDIEKGNIDPEKYTREELRRMSFNRQQDQATIEDYASKKNEYEEVKKQDKNSYDFNGNSKKI